MTTHKIDLEKEAVNQIAANKKSLITEIISDDSEEVSVKAGDILILGKDVRRSVKAVRRYPSFRIMLSNEDPKQLFPGFTKQQALRKLESRFKVEEENRGVIIYEIEPLLRLVSKKRK